MLKDVAEAAKKAGWEPVPQWFGISQPRYHYWVCDITNLPPEIRKNLKNPPQYAKKMDTFHQIFNDAWKGRYRKKMTDEEILKYRGANFSKTHKREKAGWKEYSVLDKPYMVF